MSCLNLNDTKIFTLVVATFLATPLSPPAHAVPILSKSAWTLTNHRVLSQELVQRGALDHRLSLRAVRDLGPLNLHNTGAPKLFQIDYQGIPLCRSEVRAIPVAEQDTVFIGNLPQLEAIDILATSVWPSQDEAWEQVLLGSESHQLFAPPLLQTASRCYLRQDKSLRAVWQMLLMSLGVSYLAWADADGIWGWEAQIFDLDGKARIYAGNSKTGALTDYPLKSLTGDGTLSNTLFFTEFEADKNPRAKRDDHVFVFSPGTSEFAETSIFTNANRTFDWFKENGFTKFGDRRVRLIVHASAGGNTNNALYNPSSVSGQPTIFIGDGDGILLQNLATDADVVGHEFGHHVIYSTVTTVSGESLVLHEGLADFFTFMRTDDPCLGESICPTGSRINCAVDAQCLRTADNDFSLSSRSLPTEVHFRSQFISGMLWDLKLKDGISSKDLTALVLTAVSYLVTDSGYKHLAIALLMADKNLYNGNNCAKIRARAETRGLGSLLDGVICNAPFPTILSQKSINGASEPEVKSKSSGSKGLCGFVSQARAQSHGLLIFCLCLPLFAAAFAQGLPGRRRLAILRHACRRSRPS